MDRRKQEREQRARLMSRDAWTASDVRNWLRLCGLSKYRACVLLGVTSMTMLKFAREGLLEPRALRTVLAMRYLLEHKGEWS